MQLVSRRADQSVHRSWLEVTVTCHPWVFYIGANTPVEEADGRVWSSPYPVVSFFWPRRFYQVFMLLKQDTTDYYCNVISPPVYDAFTRSVNFVDLDVDVLVVDGVIKVVDEEEFAARKSGYPPQWVDAVGGARDTLVHMAKAAAGPFSPATASVWRAYAPARCP